MGGASERFACWVVEAGCERTACACGDGGDTGVGGGGVVDAGGELLSWTVLRSPSLWGPDWEESRSSICSGWRPLLSRNATFRSRGASLIESSSRKRRACSKGSSSLAEGVFCVSGSSVDGAEEGEDGGFICQMGMEGSFLSVSSPAILVAEELKGQLR